MDRPRRVRAFDLARSPQDQVSDTLGPGRPEGPGPVAASVPAPPRGPLNAARNAQSRFHSPSAPPAKAPSGAFCWTMSMQCSPRYYLLTSIGTQALFEKPKQRMGWKKADATTRSVRVPAPGAWKTGKQ